MQEDEEGKHTNTMLYTYAHSLCIYTNEQVIIIAFSHDGSIFLLRAIALSLTKMIFCI